MKTKLLVVCILSCVSYLHSTVGNGCILTKGTKKVLLIGDIHPGIADGGKSIKLDAQHLSLFTNWLKKRVDARPTHVLVEALKSNPETINIAQLKQSPWIPFVLAYPYLAQQVNYHLGNISFVYADRRTKFLSDCSIFLHKASKVNEQTLSSFQQLKEEYFVKKGLTFTVQQFYSHLEQQAQVLEQEAAKCNLTESIKPFLSKLHTQLTHGKALLDVFNPSQLLLEALYSITCPSRIPSVENILPYCNWLLYFNSHLMDIGFIYELMQSLQNVDVSIVVAGKGHIITLRSFLLTQGFVEQKSIGDFTSLLTLVQQGNYSALDTSSTYVSVETLASFLAETETLLATYICALCSKDSINRCGVCKEVYYCSTTCQKNHWPQHKTKCKNKLTTAS